MDLFIKEIWRYPADGGARERVQEASIKDFGIVFDHPLMVVDEKNTCIAQLRLGVNTIAIDTPRSIVLKELRTTLSLTSSGMPDLACQKCVSEREIVDILVGDTYLQAVEISPTASRWITKALLRKNPGKLRLMRHVKRAWLLMISEASLQHLHEQPELRDDPAAMAMFQPDIVIVSGEGRIHAGMRLQKVT